MAANLADHIPITAIKTVSGNSPMTRSISEDASQVFFFGVPVQIDAAGFVQEWDGTTLTNALAGFSKQTGSNLATPGKGAPPTFGSVGPPGTNVTFGSVPNEPSAVNIPHGAPMVDGRTVFEAADSDTVFEGQIDNSNAGAYASTQAMIGATFGLTKDATGHWYVDVFKTNAVRIQAFNHADGIGVNAARAWFTVLKSVQQLVI